MLTFTDDEFHDACEEDTGVRPTWAVETFADVDENVRESIRRIVESPFIPRKDGVRGFVYDVETGGLREVI
jgi:carbonic anhydrase